MTTTITGLDTNLICSQYADVFAEELGCIEGEFDLDTDPTVRNVQLPFRKTPVATKKLLKEELDRLDRLGVMAKV